MRLTARQLANVALVVAIGLVATVWAVVGLAQIRPFARTAHVTVTVPSAGGALAGAEVTYLGVSIGRVRQTKLVDGGVRLRLDVRPRGPMARELRADVRQKSALGEPYVDLGPARPGVAAGDPDGVVVPIERTSVPRPLNALLSQADRILADVRPGALAQVVDGASGLAGHENDIGALLANAADIGEVLAARRGEWGDLLAASARLTTALDAHRDSMGNAISGWARVGEVLAARREDLAQILRTGGELGSEGSRLLADVRPDLAGVLAGLDVTVTNLAARPQKVRDAVRLTPTMVTRFGYTFEGGNFWLSAGGATPFFPGYQPRYGVPIYGSGLRLDRIFLPTIAQRIEVDMGGSPVLGYIRLLSPDEASAALLSPMAVRDAQQREEAELRRSPPSATP